MSLLSVSVYLRAVSNIFYVEDYFILTTVAGHLPSARLNCKALIPTLHIAEFLIYLWVTCSRPIMRKPLRFLVRQWSSSQSCVLFDSRKTGIAANAAPLAVTRNGLSKIWVEFSDKIISLYLNCSEVSKFWMSKGLWFDSLQGARNYSLFQSMQRRLNPPSLLLGEYRWLILRGKAAGSWSDILNVVSMPGMCGTMSRSHISLRVLLFNETRGRFYLTSIEHFVSSKIHKTFKYPVTSAHDAAVP